MSRAAGIAGDVTRQRFLGLATAAAALPLSAPPGLRPRPRRRAARLRFRALRRGSPIGEHCVTFRPDGPRLDRGDARGDRGHDPVCHRVPIQARSRRGLAVGPPGIGPERHGHVSRTPWPTRSPGPSSITSARSGACILRSRPRPWRDGPSRRPLRPSIPGRGLLPRARVAAVTSAQLSQPGCQGHTAEDSRCWPAQ